MICLYIHIELYVPISRAIGCCCFGLHVSPNIYIFFSFCSITGHAQSPSAPKEGLHPDSGHCSKIHHAAALKWRDDKTGNAAYKIIVVYELISSVQYLALHLKVKQLCSIDWLIQPQTDWNHIALSSLESWQVGHHVPQYLRKMFLTKAEWGKYHSIMAHVKTKLRKNISPFSGDI